MMTYFYRSLAMCECSGFLLSFAELYPYGQALG